MPDDRKWTRADPAQPKRIPRFASIAATVFVAQGLTALSPREARAEDTRSVVFVSEGPQGDVIASRVASRLPARYVAADARAFRLSLARGAPSPLANALKSHRADADLVSRTRAAGVEAHVDLAVLVYVRKSRVATLVHAWVIDARPGDSAAVDRDVPIAPGGSPDDAAAATWSAIESAFQDDLPASAAVATASSPAPAASGPAAASEESPRGADLAEADTAPRPAGGETVSLVRLGASLQGGSRHFAYVDRLTPTLRPYDLFMAPLVGIRVDVDPLVHSRVALLGGLGVTADYARAFALSSADAGGTRVSTTWQNFRVDLRDRLRVGDAVFAGLHAGFGMVDFSFDNALGAQAQLPGVAYRFLRAGADAQGAVGDLRVYGGASYLAVLSTGTVGELFPRLTVGGIEARAGVARSIARGYDLSLELAYTRFFYALRPEPGDSFVAGGALDEMVCASLGVTHGL